MKVLALLLSAALLAGCASSAATDATRDPAEAALRVRNPDLKVQWSEGVTRSPPFERVLLAPPELQFREVPAPTGPPGSTQIQDEFPVSARERERMKEDFTRIFREELADSRKLELTDQPGPGVLLVKPTLRDIVSRVPEHAVGRGETYIDNVGEATLVVDLVDSESGRTLGTITDRRKAEPAGGMGDFGNVRAGPVGAGYELRRLARRWGTSLEQRLEQLYFEAKPR